MTEAMIGLAAMMVLAFVRRTTKNQRSVTYPALARQRILCEKLFAARVGPQLERELGAAWIACRGHHCALAERDSAVVGQPDALGRKLPCQERDPV